MSASPPDARAARRAQVRVILAGSVPNLAQWFNLYVYATFAPYFRTEFFDPADQNSIVYVYAIFALTFLVRPIGSWIFGRLADARGRQLALIAAVTLMSAASLVLAVSPTQQAIGAWAAVILIGVSLIQGIATGGEYAASAVLLSESGTRGHRGFFASFQGATIVGGLVLAQAGLLVLLQVSDRTAVSDWGWRAAFAVAGLAGLSTLWWTRRLDAHAKPAARAGTVRDLFRRHWRPLLWVFLRTAGGSAAFYTFTVTVPGVVRETFFSADGHGGEVLSTAVILAALVVLMVLQPVVGALGDRIGRKPLLVSFGIGGVLLAAPTVYAATVVTSPIVLCGLLLAAFAVLTCYLAVNGITKAESFPPEIRALGVGFGYALANSLFGGTAPVAYHAAVGRGELPAFAIYITVLIAVSLFAYTRMRGGVGSTLDEPWPASEPLTPPVRR